MDDRSARKYSRYFHRIIKIICFLLLFLLLLMYAQNILRDKSGTDYVISVKAEQPGTVDIVLMGTSHMNSGIYPMELYQEFGFTAISQAQSAQSIPLSYYSLQEVLELQDPDIIVLDVYYIYLQTTYSRKEFTHQTTDHLSPLSNKVACVTDLFPQEEWAEFLLPIVSYHSRWNSLNQGDFKQAAPSITKGSDLIITHEYDGEAPVFERVPSNETKKPPDAPVEYLQKIVDLCKEQDKELVLFVLPYRAYGEEQGRDLSDDQRYFNWIRDFAEENGVSYLTMFDHIDDIGFDLKDDMREWNHLNYFGAQKVTRYLGSYLKEKYPQLENHRGQAGYESWDTSLTVYDENVKQRFYKMENPPAEDATATEKTTEAA